MHQLSLCPSLSLQEFSFELPTQGNFQFACQMDAFFLEIRLSGFVGHSCATAVCRKSNIPFVRLFLIFFFFSPEAIKILFWCWLAYHYEHEDVKIHQKEIPNLWLPSVPHRRLKFPITYDWRLLAVLSFNAC